MYILKKEGHIILTRDPSILQDSSVVVGNIDGKFSTTPSNGGVGGTRHNGAEIFYIKDFDRFL